VIDPLLYREGKEEKKGGKKGEEGTICPYAMKK